MIGSAHRYSSLQRTQPLNWTRGICHARDASIHYLRLTSAGPSLILLHGLAGNAACWTPVVRALVPDFEVVMPDARGHGSSSTPLDAYRYDDHASDILCLIQSLGLKAPILVGHSMGGMSAALMAQRHGERLGGVILMDPTFLSPRRQREVFNSDVAERHRQLLRQSKDEILADLRTRQRHRSGEILELLADARLQTRLNAFDVLVPPNPEFHGIVSAIEVPTLILLGDSPVVSIETARALQRLNPRVRVREIRNAGHGLPYDQPERCAEAIRLFAASVAKRP